MIAPQDKLAGIKPGDRVRVTFEAICVSQSGRYSVEGQAEDVCFSLNAQCAPTFHIERIEPPLKVGDRVARRDRPKGAFGSSYELRVVALRHGKAVVEMWNATLSASGEAFGIVNIDDLERIA